MTRNLTELTPYGERVVEHYMKLRNGIDDPDFAFEDEDESVRKSMRTKITTIDDDEDYDEDTAVCPHCRSPMIRINLEKGEL